MVHVALLLLMLEAAANANLVSTISQKRNTPFLQLSTSGPADYPIFRRKRPWPLAGPPTTLGNILRTADGVDEMRDDRR
jgi:hypothetical protein